MKPIQVDVGLNSSIPHWSQVGVGAVVGLHNLGTEAVEHAVVDVADPQLHKLVVVAVVEDLAVRDHCCDTSTAVAGDHSTCFDFDHELLAAAAKKIQKLGFYVLEIEEEIGILQLTE